MGQTFSQSEMQIRHVRSEEERKKKVHPLIRINPDVRICREDRRNRNSRPKVTNRVNPPPSPRSGQPEYVDHIRDEEDYGRLIETVAHIEPEFRSGVFEATDAADVELGEGEGGFGVKVLVKGCGGGGR